MNGVVLLRAVADREATGPVRPMILDVPSLVALCQALDWRRGNGGRLAGLAAGPATWEGGLREALALGLDSVTRLDPGGETPVDLAATAAAIAASLPADTDVVFAGPAASDHGAGMLPAALAGILDWPLLADAVSVRQAEDGFEAEVAAGAGKRRTYETRGPVVVVAARMSPPPLYAPLARKLAAARTPIAVVDRTMAAPGLGIRWTFLGYGPGRPRNKRLLTPNAAAAPGDRLSQLMSAGARRSTGSKLTGDADDLAGQVLDLLTKSGLIPA